MIAVSEKDNLVLQKAYRFSDLSAYSWKQRLMIRAADLVFYVLILVIGWTIRFEAIGMERFDEIESAGKQRIQCFWHESIFLATYYFRYKKIVVLSSQSFDGEYTGRFIKRFGYGTVRGSSTRGGTGALVGLIRLMKLGCPAGFAVDGPKGPLHTVKDGALILAKKTGNPVIAFSITPARFWTLKSWDKMQIPKPFTRAFVEVAAPIFVDASATDADIAEKRDEVQAVLEKLTANGAAWRMKTER